MTELADSCEDLTLSLVGVLLHLFDPSDTAKWNSSTEDVENWLERVVISMRLPGTSVEAVCFASVPVCRVPALSSGFCSGVLALESTIALSSRAVARSRSCSKRFSVLRTFAARALN
jgi:hypothetical protein